MSTIDKMLDEEKNLNGVNSVKFRAFGRAVCALFPDAMAIPQISAAIDLSRKIEAGLDAESDEADDVRDAMHDAARSAGLSSALTAIFRNQISRFDAETIADRTVNDAIELRIGSEKLASIWAAL